MEGQTTRFAGRFRPLSRLGDDELAAAAATGEPRALGVIFERYHAPLYRFCAGMLGNDSAVAADALQLTMLAAVRGLKESKPPIALRPWLYRLAHEQAAALGEAPGHAQAAAPAQEGLAERLRDLPVEQRSALLLRELSGLEYGEVAAALSMSPWAARRAVREARESLEPDEAARSAARDAQRVRELQALFVLPSAVAAALRDAGPAAIRSEDDEDREHHRVLVAFLVLAVALGSVAAIAALGTFHSSRSGAGAGAFNAGGPTPIEVSPGRIQVSPGRFQVAPGGSGAAPSLGQVSPGVGQVSPAQPPVAPGRTPVLPGPAQVRASGAASAVAGYTTPGERNEGVLGGG